MKHRDQIEELRGPRRAAAIALLLLLSFAGVSSAEESKAPEPAAPPSSEAASEAEVCVESDTVMCLQDGRYAVTMEWETLGGEKGPGRVARPRTRDSGLFWFFEYNNWEVLLKVLDGCGVNKHHWVYAASATDLGLNIVVRDTVTDQEKVYFKEPGKPAPATTDAGAFPDSCEAPS
ncbi:MAG: hypothetical protein F4X59_11980 [Holophagales bacterium]|nr:hypothetical protein [Holophagales bacterium]MYC10834.1 hypothetical protein [Holophagales bacterium]